MFIANGKRYRAFANSMTKVSFTCYNGTQKGVAGELSGPTLEFAVVGDGTRRTKVTMTDEELEQMVQRIQELRELRARLANTDLVNYRPTIEEQVNGVRWSIVARRSPDRAEKTKSPYCIIVRRPDNSNEVIDLPNATTLDEARAQAQAHGWIIKFWGDHTNTIYYFDK